MRFVLLSPFAIAIAFIGSTAFGGDPPNIILILADDLGYGELGCYGQRLIKTPNIDGLANNGTRFNQFYAGQCVCAASRCSLLTGRHMGHANIRNNGNPPERRAANPAADYFPGQRPLADSEVTLAELLHKQGYKNAVIGKWGLGYEESEGHPLRQGFDRFYGYLCQGHAHNHNPRFLWSDTERERLTKSDDAKEGDVYAEDRFADEALAFIRAHRDEPFFLFYTPTIPHVSIQVPDAALADYENVFAETPYQDKSSYKKHPKPHAGYAAMVSYLDKDIGRMVGLIDELGLTDNTLILFTSDNGPTYGRVGGADSDFFHSSGPLRGRKASLYEGGIRVPLVAKWPGHIPAGATSEHVAAFWDLLPTICELTGADPPACIDGQSFAGALAGKQSPEHEYLYWEFPSYGGQQAVRMGNWKAVRTGLMKKPAAKFELYDLATDLGEQHNVAAEHPEVVAEIARIASETRTPSERFPFPALDEAQQ